MRQNLIVLLFLVLAVPVLGESGQTQRRLLQMAEYLGADYPNAVQDSRIVDQNEYREMTEFAGLILEGSSTLPSSGTSDIARQLHEAVQEKLDVRTIRSLTARLRQRLLESSPELSLPSGLLPPGETIALYQQRCASCHGPAGRGDGVLAPNLDPPPTDFTDRVRSFNRSLLGLFDTISSGIEGTSMTAFNDLSEIERWSLAFYTGSLAYKPGKASVPDGLELAQWINSSPAILSSSERGPGIEVIERLRADPAPFFERRGNPLSLTRNNLQAALAAYRSGNPDEAHDLAVSAYLDGFELIETTLDTRDSTLRKETESNLIALRALIRDGVDAGQIEELLDTVLGQLDHAEALMTGDNLSDTTLFTASFIILLREGLEALLVVLILATVLTRTGRSDAMKYLHVGWVSALVAGLATWWASRFLLDISGASREVMEGTAALMAAVILFYVGFWMHGKTQAHHWQAYIQRNINESLGSGMLWGVAGLSFIAVYREIFEMVLFYQSLLLQAASGQYSMVLAGLFTGIASLALVSWLMIRYSIRLPVAAFFSTTTWLLLALSFILMGKAIAALQEAAIIDISPLPVDISVDWLGIHATWQGIGAQLVILLLSAWLLLRQRSGEAAV